MNGTGMKSFQNSHCSGVYHFLPTDSLLPVSNNSAGNKAAAQTRGQTGQVSGAGVRCRWQVQVSDVLEEYDRISYASIEAHGKRCKKHHARCRIRCNLLSS